MCSSWHMPPTALLSALLHQCTDCPSLHKTETEMKVYWNKGRRWDEHCNLDATTMETVILLLLLWYFYVCVHMCIDKIYTHTAIQSQNALDLSYTYLWKRMAKVIPSMVMEEREFGQDMKGGFLLLQYKVKHLCFLADWKNTEKIISIEVIFFHLRRKDWVSLQTFWDPILTWNV